MIRTKKNKYQCTSDRVLVYTCYIFVAIIAFITLFPFWELLVTSISNRADAVKTGFKLFTLHPEFTAYQQVLSSANIWNSILNSVIRVITGTVLSVGLTALTAYPLSKKDFIWGKAFTLIILFTMLSYDNNATASYRHALGNDIAKCSRCL
ncbi:MAG: hypothetical protein RR444_08000 [Oscillospiraceae bacterium]